VVWAGPKLAFAAILAGAAALRLVGVNYAHPFALFSPDEQSIVPRAWHMAHGGGLDPHWFDYPSLLMYVLAPFQAWEAHPSYLAARLVVDRAGGRLRGGGLVAGQPFVRRPRRACCGGLRRGRDDPRRLLAHGGDRRAFDTRGRRSR
jgi:hypothetical protein